MRLGPFELGRVRAADTPLRARPPLGASGTINQAGWIVSDEYNPDLRWPKSLDVYLRMRRSDASVREALWHIFAPILNADWAVEPGGADPEDLEVAAFAEHAFFEWPVEPFSHTLRQALLYLAQGYQVFETVEQVVEHELHYLHPDTGDLVELDRGQYLCWRRFAHLRPETIQRWHVEDGELQAVTQGVYTDDGYDEPRIPAESLVVLVNEKEGDDFRGVSLLRTAQKSWWLKETVERIAGIAYERHGVGIFVGYVPKDRENDDALIDRVEKILQNLRAGEFPYAVMPGPKGEITASAGSTGGYFLDVLTPSGGIPDFTPFLEYLRGEIKGNVLARFSELGHGSTGARATSDTQSLVWLDAVHSVADYVADEFNVALRRLVDKNYRTSRYPKLVVRDIENQSLLELADFVAKTGAVKALLPDRSLRQALRSAADLPEEDEDAEEQTRDPMLDLLEKDPTDPEEPAT